MQKDTLIGMLSHMTMPPPLGLGPPSNSALRRIGRFYLTRELGRGTVGCVYLARDPVLARDLAIKTFNPDLTELEKYRYQQQFINEARAAARLAHPHIVTVYDACNDGGEAYVAMEYLQGRELNKMLAGGRRFTPDEVAAIARKIAGALHHAHRREVIHRDVKPGNIFMVDDRLPKLIDFGIARSPERIAARHSASGEAYTLMQVDQVLGTPHYMSPEQAVGASIDARTDIYSLGAVMYEMLTGQTPFQADSAARLLQDIVSETPLPPHRLNAKIPETLSNIVMVAMNKRPENRYETAELMALRLKRYLVHERRARRGVSIARRAAELAVKAEAPPLRRKLHWIGFASLAATVLVACATWLL